MRWTIFSIAVVIAFSGGNAFSQTMSYADAMQRLATTCGSDIQKYCEGANLGKEQVKNCLVANQAKVSPSCGLVSSLCLFAETRGRSGVNPENV